MRTIILGILLATATAFADEKLDVTPAPQGDLVSGFHISRISIKTLLLGQGAGIEVGIIPTRTDGLCARDVQGSCLERNFRYEGADAVAFINQLNSADFSTVSMRRRILRKLQQDGFLPSGTVSGTPGIPSAPTPPSTPIP